MDPLPPFAPPRSAVTDPYVEIFGSAKALWMPLPRHVHLLESLGAEEMTENWVTLEAEADLALGGAALAAHQRLRVRSLPPVTLRRAAVSAVETAPYGELKRRLEAMVDRGDLSRLAGRRAGFELVKLGMALEWLEAQGRGS